METNKKQAKNRVAKEKETDILDYSLRRYCIDEFYARHVSHLPNGVQILDIGGTRSAKRGKFNIEHYPVTVRYLNLSPVKHPDILGNAAYLPLKDGCFDVVICAEVLEHVPDPRIIIEEMYRVLHSGGILFASVPFLNSIHADPYDYGRYTDCYWRENLAKVGFRDITIERQGLFWSVLVDIIREFVRYYMHVKRTITSRFVRRGIYRIMGWAKQKAVDWDSRPGRQQHPLYSRFTTGFGIIAKK